MHLRSSLFLCLLFLAHPAPTQAAVVITVGSSLVAPGGSVDYLPVYINTDNGTVDLAATNFEFQITTNGSTALQFVGSSDPSVDPTFANPNYVFAGASTDYDTAVNFPNLAPYFHLGYANTSTDFAGTDMSDNSNGYVQLTTTAKLLALLPVTTLTNAAPPAGDTLSVALINSPSTSFTDENLSSVSVLSDSFNPVQTTVTPEPSTLVFGLQTLAALGAAAAARRRRRRRAGQRPNA